MENIFFYANNGIPKKGGDIGLYLNFYLKFDNQAGLIVGSKCRVLLIMTFFVQTYIFLILNQ